MEERLVKIIREEVDEFMKTLDSHLEDSKQRLDTKIDYLKKSFGSIPSDKSEEKRFKNAERIDAEDELKDVLDMEKDVEERKKDLKDAENEKTKTFDHSNITNAPTTQPSPPSLGGI